MYRRLITNQPRPDHGQTFWQTALALDCAVDAAVQGDPTEEPHGWPNYCRPCAG